MEGRPGAGRYRQQEGGRGPGMGGRLLPKLHAAAWPSAPRAACAAASHTNERTCTTHLQLRTTSACCSPAPLPLLPPPAEPLSTNACTGWPILAPTSCTAEGRAARKHGLGRAPTARPRVGVHTHAASQHAVARSIPRPSQATNKQQWTHPVDIDGCPKAHRQVDRICGWQGGSGRDNEKATQAASVQRSTPPQAIQPRLPRFTDRSVPTAATPSHLMAVHQCQPRLACSPRLPRPAAACGRAPGARGRGMCCPPAL